MTFTDKKGRAWSLALSVGTVRRVKELTGLSLGGFDQRTFETLAGDWEKLVDVVCAIVRPQLAAKDISDEDFAEALGGVEIEAATDALLAAMVDFFPPKMRPVLETAMARLETLKAKAMARATARLESLDLPPETPVSGASCGNAPALSESTPTVGLSAV